MSERRTGRPREDLLLRMLEIAYAPGRPEGRTEWRLSPDLDDVLDATLDAMWSNLAAVYPAFPVDRALEERLSRCAPILGSPIVRDPALPPNSVMLVPLTP